ncbi:MAG: RNase J family beta-CASP ribonuclease [Nanoarchaeota archaeon]|nr:RNase J family beta-CASP ribonuclease [Nanoarchaeota archaeon]
MAEIITLGGYNEVGKNLTAVKVGKQVVIFDMGLHLENYIRVAEDEDIINLKAKMLIDEGAVPDIDQLGEWKKQAGYIIPTHAHLDHIGAIPFLGNQFKANLIFTPYSAAVLNANIKNEGMKLSNKQTILNVNGSIPLKDGLRLEFINVTHSTPQTVMAALHTPEGVILYANDFKFDMYPTLGKKPNFKRLEELGKEGVLALICDSTYANYAQKTPSESVAKEMLRDVMIGTQTKGKCIIVTTFSSHLARLKSIIEFGKKLNRRIVFLGRSLAKYSLAGEDIGIVNFSKEAEIVKYSSKIKRKLKTVMADGKEKYMLVVTGHQGEPKATLSKMASGELGFRFDKEDHVIFSCKTIPSKTNIENRTRLENELKDFDVRLFTDIHVSGHAAREDLRDLIHLVKPKHIIPAHGERNMTLGLINLAETLGYSKGETAHHMKNGGRLRL